MIIHCDCEIWHVLNPFARSFHQVFQTSYFWRVKSHQCWSFFYRFPHICSKCQRWYAFSKCIGFQYIGSKCKKLQYICKKYPISSILPIVPFPLFPQLLFYYYIMLEFCKVVWFICLVTFPLFPLLLFYYYFIIIWCLNFAKLCDFFV